jgi:hypothetical protein
LNWRCKFDIKPYERGKRWEFGEVAAKNEKNEI